MRWPDPLLWKLGVSSVAERRIRGSFALAEECFAILFGRKGLWREIGSTMRAIAERLASGFTATAVVIGLAGLKYHSNGLTACDRRFTHGLGPLRNRNNLRSKSKNTMQGPLTPSRSDFSPLTGAPHRGSCTFAGCGVHLRTAQAGPRKAKLNSASRGRTSSARRAGWFPPERGRRLGRW